jgi:hypothetical protein
MCQVLQFCLEISSNDKTMNKTLLLFFGMLGSILAQAQTTVVTGLTSPNDIAIDGNNLYFGNGTVVSTIDITDANPVVQTVTTATAFAMDVVGSDLYIAEYPYDRLAQVNVGATFPVAANLIPLGTNSEPTAVASIGATLYAITRNTAVAGGKFLSGGSISNLQLTGTVVGMAAGGDILYITTRGGIIYSVDTSMPNPTVVTVKTGLGDPYGIAISGDFLYVTDMSGDKLYRINRTISNPPVTTLVWSGLGNPTGVAINGQDLYITGYTSGSIYKVTDPAIVICTAPSSIQATSAGATSVDISWGSSSVSSTWDLAITDAGQSIASGTEVTGISTNSQNMGGLTAGNSYDIYVKTYCSSLGTSTDWSDPLTYCAGNAAAVAQNIAAQLDPSTGLVTIDPAQVNNGSSNYCNTVLSLSKAVFSCEDIGDNIVTLTVTESNGSTATANATVTITSWIVDQAVSAANAAICTDGATSTTISTASSETGMNYYLRDSEDNSIIDGPIAGNGSALDFNTGNLSAPTTFNVYAEKEIPLSGKALEFDGTNDYISLGTDHRNIVDNLTIAAWIKTGSSLTNKYIANKYASGTGFLLRFEGGRVGIAGGDGAGYRGGVYSTTLVNDNQWHYVVATIEAAAGEWKIYVDGLLEGTASYGVVAGASLVSGGGNLEIGLQSGKYFPGSIDNVEVWNTPLSASAIQTNMTNCLTGSESGLVGLFRIDEGSGSTVSDLSPSAIDGTLINMDPITDWVSGISKSCIFLYCGAQMATEITVGEQIVPTAIAQDVTIQLDANGNATLAAASVNNGSSDNCTAGEALILSLDITAFTCADFGSANTVTLTVEDASGNSATATATVTVEDNVAPTAVGQNIIILLDGAGNATTSASAVNNGSSDNCTDEASLVLSLDQSTFTCADLGANTVTLTVEDASGNQSTTTATVNVEDHMAPTAIAQDITVQLDASGNVTIVADDIDNGSGDNCASGIIASIDVASFDCADIGTNAVTLTVEDGAGIQATAIATVTVEDNVAPTAMTRDITVNLDNSGNATITATQVNDGSSDNCTDSGALIMSLDVTSFTVSNLGANTVTLTVEDGSGNSSSATATVTIEEKTVQTITFGALADVVYGESLTLSASSDSALPVSYEVITGSATISGSTVTTTGVGSVTIEATQAGDATFGVATAVQQSFTVATATLTATADDQTITYGDAIPTLTFAYSGFINEESATVLTAEPTIATSAIETSDAGSYSITVTGGTADNYSFNLVDATLSINKADQSISLEVIADKQIADAAFDISAATTSGLDLSYAIASGPATINGTTVTLDGTVGTVTITANQVGNINFNAASEVSTSFIITDPSKTDQTITIDAIADKLSTDTPFDVVASTTSNLTLAYAIESGPATISGTTITLDGTAGTVVVNVTQDGDATFNPGAASTSFDVTINVDPCAGFGIALQSTTDVVAGDDGAVDITVSGGTAPYAFSWSNGATTEDLSGIIGGDYTLTVTDDNGCSQTLAVTVGDIVLATVPNLEDTGFSYYPNPVNEQLTIEASFDKVYTVEVLLLDMSGRVMVAKSMANVDQISTRLETGTLESGQYVLMVKTSHTQQVARITITH